MPRPAPLIWKLARSSGAPCASHGNQPMGTEIVRPSSKSTVKVSSVIMTSTALGGVSTATAEGIPFMS